MKKISFLLLVFILATSCSKKKNDPPETVYADTFQKLENSKTLSFDIETESPPETVIQENYTIKKENYEPYLHYFFRKEIKGFATIFYNLESFAVVQDSLKKTTHFNMETDRYIPNYLNQYNQNPDNLLTVAMILKRNKDSYKYLGKEELGDIKTYKYSFENMAVWESIKNKMPVKFVINPKFDDSGKLTSYSRSFSFSKITLDTEIADAAFIPEKHPDYDSIMFKPKVKPLINEQAKDWTLSSTEGKQLSLSDFKGQTLFLEAWNSNCEHCIASIPAVKEIQKKFGDKIKVVSIGLNPNIDELKQAIKEHSIKYPVLLTNDKFSADYDISLYPAYYVIDKTGKIIYYDNGTIADSKKKQLFQVLDSIK